MESRIKVMIALGVLAIIIPFLGIPITPKLYILSFLAVVYTLITLSIFYGIDDSKDARAYMIDTHRKTDHASSASFNADTYDDRDTNTTEEQYESDTSHA